MFLLLVGAAIMVMVTVVIHGIGLALLGRILRRELHHERELRLPRLSARAVLFTLLAVLGMFALHGIEIWLYALAYLVGGAIPTLETAVYFSTISYAAIGFSDHYIVESWRLIAGIEGINGAVLLGWSTAFFVTMVVRLER